MAHPFLTYPAPNNSSNTEFIIIYQTAKKREFLIGNTNWERNSQMEPFYCIPI